MWRFFIRPILFRLDEEWVHYFAMNSFSLSLKLPFAKSTLRRMTQVSAPGLAVKFLGLDFKNPVGLAAGFDKDARWYDQLSLLGFSHIEVGTLTGQPQPGNPKKRLFRFPKDQALLNCMGFNNRGSAAARHSMQESGSSRDAQRSILGINIGLSKTVAVAIAENAQSPDAAQEENAADPSKLGMAIDDYLLSFQRMHPYADYFTINVSSPNTKGLRDLQHPRKIGQLIRAIRQENEKLTQEDSVPKPILVKLAPDLSESELAETIEALMTEKVDGLIATNTTISDSQIATAPQQVQSKRCQCPAPGGGFSGRPLTLKSREFVSRIYRLTEGQLPIIGVGGIMSGEDAWEMIAAGASLVQVYTGFVYGGPFFVKSINRYLSQRLQQENLTSINEVVGTKSGAKSGHASL